MSAKVFHGLSFESHQWRDAGVHNARRAAQVRRWYPGLLLALYPWSGFPQGEDETSRSRDLREEIYVQLVEAQTCMEAGDSACAERVLDTVEARRDLNTYETAQALNFRAHIRRSEDDIAEAVLMFEEILALPDLPPAFEGRTWGTIAGLLYEEQQHQDALAAVDIALSALPDDTMLIEFRQRIMATINGEPQIHSVEELHNFVDELVYLVESTYDCTLSIFGEPFFNSPGESVVLYSLDGRDCEQALDLMERRGTPWKIVFARVGPAPDSRPAYPFRGLREPPRDLTLIHEIIE